MAAARQESGGGEFRANSMARARKGREHRD